MTATHQHDGASREPVSTSPVGDREALDNGQEQIPFFSGHTRILTMLRQPQSRSPSTTKAQWWFPEL